MTRTIDTPPADEVPRFGLFEKSFRHAGAYANPYRDLDAVATLRRPDGARLSIPLFWDGDKDWKLRVSPDLTGVWSYSVSSPDSGMQGVSGSFRCVGSELRGGIQPVAGHPLHFQYQDGTPFFFLGDKAWRLLQTDRAKGLDRASALHHVDVRAAQGFTYLHTELAGTGGLHSGGNEGGEMFLDAAIERLNPAFFREVDTRVLHVSSRRLVLGIVLLYARGDPSWLSLPGQDARLRFARYVVARYAAFPVVFLVTGEWQYMVREMDMFRAIGRELKKTDPHGRMIGIHPGPGPYFSSQEFAPEEWMSFGEYAQAYFAPELEEASDAHRHDLREFIVAARRHGKPVVDAEYGYYLRDQDFDGIVDKPHSHSRESFRRASWMMPMSGGYFVTGFGTTYFGGRREVGPFLVDNPKHAEAIADLDRLRRFFTSLAWWLLEPHDECVSSPTGYTYCMAEPGAPFAVTRYDPRTGESAGIAQDGMGPVRLDPPDTQDWIFLATSR